MLMRKLPGLIVAGFMAAILTGVTAGVAKLNAALPQEHEPGKTFVAEPFVPNITFPADIGFTPDGMLYVAQRFVGVTEPFTGAVAVVNPDGFVQETPFAVVDLAENTPFHDKGLLGLAIDPDYDTNHFVYVYFIAPAGDHNPAHHGEIVRFTAVLSGGNWIGAQRTTLVDNLPASVKCCHNGGTLEFGPDGKLYLSIGDNSISSNGQDLTTAASAILRYNPDGSIPEDNPFTQTVGAEPAIYAYGIRNSFGFSWHPLTGEMFASDNGPACNDELNRIIAGGNYGWDVISCGPSIKPYIAPLWVLDPPVGVTGVAFYTPSFALDPYLYLTSWSNGLENGLLYQFVLDEQGDVAGATLEMENCGQPPDVTMHGLALAVSPAGDLYMACQEQIFPAPIGSGVIYRIRLIEPVPNYLPVLLSSPAE